MIGAKVCKDSIAFRNNIKLQDKYFLISAYFKDVENLTSIPDKKDFTHVFVRDNILTNVKGGIGFFGAEYKETLPWALLLSPMEKSESSEMTHMRNFSDIEFK